MAEASKGRDTATLDSQLMGFLSLLDGALVVPIGNAEYVQVTPGRKEIGVHSDKLFTDVCISGLNEKGLVSTFVRKKYTTDA